MSIHSKRAILQTAMLLALSFAASTPFADDRDERKFDDGNFTRLSAPAGDLPATLDTSIEGAKGSILPNGRFLTPSGIQVDVKAPKPYGMALSPDGTMLATINSGAKPFSVSLIQNLGTDAPKATRIDLASTFMGIAFSPDGKRFYAAGGENGNIWVGDVALGQIIASVNLNGPAHPATFAKGVDKDPEGRFKGAFLGNLVLSPSGQYLYVVDQAGFKVHVVDTTKINAGLDEAGKLQDANNFTAVVGSQHVGRYPYGITIDHAGRTLLVTHVGTFQYKHLLPKNPTGNSNEDFPLCYPGAGYPEDTTTDKTIKIKKVDPRNLPADLRDPEGIRCGYISTDREYVVPGLGSPNAPEASSVYALDLVNPTAPVVKRITKTGLKVGEYEKGLQVFAGSHPNAVVIGPNAIYVANGNNDTISVLDPQSFRETRRISLTVLKGSNERLKGIMPVALALSPNNEFLYVAEVGINAVGVVNLSRQGGEVVGHIPVGWWPSSIRVSNDGKVMFVANARGRGAGANLDQNSSPKVGTMGSVSILPVPSAERLRGLSGLVLRNNGFAAQDIADGYAHLSSNPIPSRPGKASRQIKHVVFINKENATHDLLLGNITVTRKGVAVNGDPSFALPPDAAPNHNELALRFALGDNFYLEPSVSSDGHRWLTNTYPTEFEDTHWPASYGGQRNDAGDDPEVIENYPGRLGFTDANSSPEPNDLNEHGGIYQHLKRNHRSFVNFGNGYEFAIVDEAEATEPTGIRHHVNVPMEKVLRDNSDHLYPEYNTHIPDAPLSEDPGRFSRFGRFKQVFENRYVNRSKGTCKLPSYVDLYYPNDHGGGANDIYPDGNHPWDFKRFVQDNDAALGLTVDLISNSPCWKDTVIFVVEDDTQNGGDHVDGHRSVFLVISPWVKHEYVSKKHLSLASIFKTVNLILGIPPQNQYDAAATDLRDLFTSTPDFKPFSYSAPLVAKLANPLWLAMTKDIDFSKPDRDEVKLRNAIMKSEGLPRKVN